MVKISIVFLWCLFSVVSTYGQQQTYFVQFKNKNNSSFSVDRPGEFLSEKAIARRAKCLVKLDEKDLPVTQSYVDQVVLQGAQLLYSLKWFNGVVVRSDATVKAQIAALNIVLSVDQSVKFRVSSSKTPYSVLKRKHVLSTHLGQASTQQEMLGMHLMHDDGYTGKDVLIAITDDGFLNVDTNPGFTSIFQEGRVLGTWDLVDLDTSVYGQGGGHGSHVFSIIAGSIDGQFSGPAVDSKFMLFRTEDVASESPLEELNWVKAAEIADSAGADIIQVSLGYTTFDDAALDYTQADLDGKSSYVSRGASLAYAKGMIVVASAGNEGNSSWRKITCPADVDGVIAVGAVDDAKDRVGFSSVGNTADGRLKPDVMAMGADVVLIATNGVVSSGSGTSFASPLISGLIAGLLDGYPTLTHKEMIYVLKQSADRFTSPDSFYGYGIPNYQKASDYAKIIADKESFLVFPNPFRTQLQVKVPQDAIGKTLAWSLTSNTGQLISEGEQKVESLVLTLWTDGQLFSSGFYQLKLSLDDGFRTFSVIKY
jgi:serine protease AprX